MNESMSNVSSQPNPFLAISKVADQQLPSSLKFVVANIKRIVSIQLDGDNYPIWKLQVLKIFSANNFEGFLLGTLLCPNQLSKDNSTANPDYNTWTMIDRNLTAALYSTINASILPHILNLSSCAEIWTTLAKRLQPTNRSKLIQLKNELHNVSMKNKTMAQYLSSVKMIVDSLTAAGSQIDHEDIILYILNGLPSSYQSFKTSIRTMLTPISLDDLYSLLYREEINNLNEQGKELSVNSPQQAFSTTTRGRPPPYGRGRGRSMTRGRGRYRNFQVDRNQQTYSQTPVQCQICGKIGHSALNCWHRGNMDYTPSVQPAATNPQHNTLYNNRYNNTSDWVLDTGATSHLSPNLDQIQQAQPYYGPDDVVVGNDTSIPITNHDKGILSTPSRMDGEEALDGPIEERAKIEVKEVETLLSSLGIVEPFTTRHSANGIFCSRTLNLRSISAIGYDMDYTLIHYNVMAWEGRAYDYGMANLESMGFPVDDLKFDPNLVIRGLVMDKERGNLVKADRFGYVKRAMHGTKMLSTRSVSEIYGRELVDLRKESRWEFLNTLFSVSEAVMYMQMVDKLDQGTVPAELGPLDYKGLFKAVSKALFRAHVEGQLKSEIMAEPERFVEPDPELPLALLDQKEAGKKLLLITNSDYHYTNKMMHHAFNRFLPNDMEWRDLFDMVIVSARKPEFFQMTHPLYEVVTADGLMRPCFKARSGGLYSGGSAQIVEKSLGVHGDEILYVGDHIFTDVSQSKVHLRWRTALICRELEDEFNALVCSRDHRTALIKLVHLKEVVGDLFNQLRLALQRRTKDHLAQTLAATKMADHELTENLQKLLIIMQRLDQKIGPMLEVDGERFNKRWGYLSRAGLWDKSHLTRQIEKYADIYTSRVSNFLLYTPFMYFCSQEQTLAHDSYSYTSPVINRIGGHDL